MTEVIAVDLGGTSLRVARVARDGDITRLATRPHRIGPEADAESWLAAMFDGIAEVGTAGIAGLCIGAFTRSQVLTDEAGTPVRPALCFPDTTGLPVPGAEAGTWMAMTPFHPVARLARLARDDPASLARARHLLQPAEFLAMRLTGRPAADRIANSWAVTRDGAATTAPLTRAGLDPALLPDLVPPGTPLGAYNGIPVFSGSMDTWMATIGAGVGAPGDAYLIAGTTDAGGVLTRTPAARPGLVTLPWGEQVFHTGGPSAAGGACLDWAARLLGLPDAAAVIAMAEQAAPALPLCFVPALMGSRAPYWRAEGRGALIGLDMAHGPAEVARAVVEGIAFADRDLMGGLPFDRLVIAGGGARADFACQVRADVMGRPVLRVAGESGLVGAAMLAWRGLGVYPSIATAQAAMVRHDRVFAPQAGMGYEGMYEGFRRHAAAAE